MKVLNDFHDDIVTKMEQGRLEMDAQTILDNINAMIEWIEAPDSPYADRSLAQRQAEIQGRIQQSCIGSGYKLSHDYIIGAVEHAYVARDERLATVVEAPVVETPTKSSKKGKSEPVVEAPVVEVAETPAETTEVVQ